MLSIEVDGKDYVFGYPTRESAIKAEDEGLDLSKADKLVRFADTIFYTGLLFKQEDMTREKAKEIEEKYMAEGGDITEITSFLIKQYSAFIQSPEKKKKKAKIVKFKV